MISNIAIFDLSTGTATSFLRSDRHLEAPNWMPGDDQLLVNSDGRLFRLPLEAPRLEPIDTGFARRINNDHGLSPDGRLIAITDKTETGKACIYTLPSAGGTPKRVSENTPSYFHGWSPDGGTITYPAFRHGYDDGADIYICPADGGPERRLTFGFDTCDGPDHTPDGAWIWFNGEKNGAVDLWRIRLDGSGLEQMTFDTRVNWFPHPSPDGAHVLYMSYEPGTEGHPPNRDVDLRLMPAEGGEARILLRLFGGQGTLNSPCWASDGRRFAFVSYEV
ncbi:TolB family protein [Aliiruegeria lutimaris]|uniref:WD40-like Beta Propeller Repeat n=1 Tax=Aliiruegeria lutimaris TaxID=571298 RepID=A0A1G9ITF2_9RHOB|nr:TolB family protein [Aliiruegeria lutimaris]SDL28203.1 WD40-like Beta Propeller Repeat [Aliiruegeria lutimaris]